jgi:hypothetical protein
MRTLAGFGLGNEGAKTQSVNHVREAYYAEALRAEKESVGALEFFAAGVWYVVRTWPCGLSVRNCFAVFS